MYFKTMFLFSAMILLNVSVTVADEPLDSIEGLASKDLLAVAYIDLKSVSLEECLDWGTEQEMIEADVADEMKHMAGVAQEFLRQATDAGADHLIAMVHQDDLLFRGAPLIVVSIADGKDPQRAYRSLRRTMALLQIPDFKLELWNGSILGGTEQQISRAKSEAVVERPRMKDAWKKFGGHDAGLMVFGSADSRRVLKEMFPTLEAPFQGITGQMIAEDVVSLGATIELPAEVGARIVVQSTNPDSAKVIEDSLRAGMKLLTDKDGEYFDQVPKIAHVALSVVEPKLVSNDVVIDLKPILNDKVQLQSLLNPIRSGSRQTQRTNKIRQITLAMLNHESAYKAFPAYANFDEDGKPLLSWRVHILPFIEEGALYEQFKLDEPWDSPHNIKLVEKMPVCFADPSMGLADLNKAGKTRYLVPRTEGTMFHKVEGITFGDITDGSSNTIAIVSVKPAKAVIWTKPVDWEVDLDNPKADLIEGDSPATVSRADGSTFTIESDMKTEKLKALLTVSGGETP